mgnify:CR=1 FL=1
MHDQSSPSGSLDDESPVADEQTDQVQASKGVLRKPSALSYEWHIRLGHPGEKQVIHFKKDLDLCGVEHVPSALCEHCSLAKSTWQISEYSTTHPEVTRPFEVIHIDLCGPFYRPLAYGNTRYFLTIVDRLSL